MLNPGELPVSERKRLLGVVYLEAVAAVAGYAMSVPGSDFDSIDAQVKSRVGRRHQLEFQVKCTAMEVGSDPEFPFELSKKNYDDLRAETIVPRLLLVVITPVDFAAWIRQTERRLNFRRCGYWVSLHGQPERPNTTSITIRVPRANLLTPSALQALMMDGIAPASQSGNLSGDAS